MEMRSGVDVTGNKLGPDRQLGRRQAEALSGLGLGDTIDLEQYLSGPNDRNPRFQRSLTVAHTGFQRLFRKALIRKYTNPHLSVPLHFSADGNAGCFDFLGVKPTSLQRLQTELAKRDEITPTGQTSPVSALHLTVFNSCGHQRHIKILLD